MTHSKNLAPLVILAAILLALPFRANSVEPLHMYLRDMVAQADYILVARVVGLYDGEGPEKYARIEPITEIKGSGPTTILYKSGISEHDPDCCELGARYLFFLQRTPSGAIVTIGGREGAVKATSN